MLSTISNLCIDYSLSPSSRFSLLFINSNFSPLSPTRSTNEAENVIYLSFQFPWRPMQLYILILVNKTRGQVCQELVGNIFHLIKANWEKLLFLYLWMQWYKDMLSTAVTAIWNLERRGPRTKGNMLRMTMQKRWKNPEPLRHCLSSGLLMLVMSQKDDISPPF